jgi:hypothetical protein
VAALHALVAGHLAEDVEPGEVVGIETDRGPLVQALIAAGYLIDAVNPLQVARYRARHGTSGAKERPRECARAGRAAFDAARVLPGRPGRLRRRPRRPGRAGDLDQRSLTRERTREQAGFGVAANSAVRRWSRCTSRAEAHIVS